MVQQFRALVVLAKDHGCEKFPEIIWWLTTICSSSSRGSDTLFDPLRTMCVRSLQKEMKANIHIKQKDFSPVLEFLHLL